MVIATQKPVTTSRPQSFVLRKGVFDATGHERMGANMEGKSCQEPSY